MLKAILFDMDGVIVDSEPLHKKAYYKMFQDVNIVVSSKVFASFTGQATLRICQKLCLDFNLKQAPEDLDGIDGPLARHYNVKDNASEYDGVLLDLIIDYLTYVFIPAYALFQSGLLDGFFLAFIYISILLQKLVVQI